MENVKIMKMSIRKISHKIGYIFLWMVVHLLRLVKCEMCDIYGNKYNFKSAPISHADGTVRHHKVVCPECRIRDMGLRLFKLQYSHDNLREYLDKELESMRTYVKVNAEAYRHLLEEMDK